MKKVPILTLLVLMIVPATLSAQRLSPRSTVETFYKFDRSHSQTFNRRNIDARKRWLSASLYRMFVNELRLENVYLKDHPDDKPFFGDGLPFRPYEESCGVAGRSYSSKYNVGRTTMTRSAADVTITVSWPDLCKLAPDRYRVRLVRERSGWKVDDIIYSDRSTLTQDMRAHQY